MARLELLASSSFGEGWFWCQRPVGWPLKGGDPAFAAFSPGQLIIHATLQRAFAEGLDRYEFLGDTAEYKRRWATSASNRLLFQGFAPTLPGHLYRDAFMYGRPLAKKLLRSS